ncbi:MAG: hypothetical protein R3F46_03365 [bacterium]
MSGTRNPVPFPTDNPATHGASAIQRLSQSGGAALDSGIISASRARSSFAPETDISGFEHLSPLGNILTAFLEFDDVALTVESCWLNLDMPVCSRSPSPACSAWELYTAWHWWTACRP